jgi:hypothetical protein
MAPGAAGGAIGGCACTGWGAAVAGCWAEAAKGSREVAQKTVTAFNFVWNLTSVSLFGWFSAAHICPIPLIYRLNGEGQ